MYSLHKKLNEFERSFNLPVPACPETGTEWNLKRFSQKCYHGKGVFCRNVSDFVPFSGFGKTVYCRVEGDAGLSRSFPPKHIIVMFLHLMCVCVCNAMASYQRNVSVGNLRSKSLPLRTLRRDSAKIGVYS